MTRQQFEAIQDISAGLGSKLAPKDFGALLETLARLRRALIAAGVEDGQLVIVGKRAFGLQQGREELDLLLFDIVTPEP